MLTLFLSIFLSYFDTRKRVLLVQAVFLAANILFTGLTLSLGANYYGFGFFVASLLSFVCAALLCIRYVEQLPYHAFISTNTSIA